jgi:acyl-CoA synthetase (AMP-forming)/AMP-acid ligase II
MGTTVSRITGLLGGWPAKPWPTVVLGWLKQAGARHRAACAYAWIDEQLREDADLHRADFLARAAREASPASRSWRGEPRVPPCSGSQEPPMQYQPAQTTVRALLGRGADAAVAIAAPQRAALTHGGLLGLADRTATTLTKLGIGRGDRVALVVPNGPEAATSFVCIATTAATAPLNPGYRAEEFDFYLGDLRARALVLPQGFDTPARAVAAGRNIPVIDLVAANAAGDFSLHAAGPIGGASAAPDDVALVLHTSGTTSRPKVVPLTQQNVCASAAHIGAALALTPDDCCLNIMPLFHIHGLIAAVLSSLAAGASVFCTPGFNAFRFFAWFTEAQPTWVTAVPTMHQAVLPYAERNRDTIAAGRVRLLRSSSASLPPQVMMALEAAFGVPVIESYGMTEAAHQMTSNPLPPKKRFPGSVGVAAGPKVAIMDEAGALLPAGSEGEVVISGPNVTAGYEANPEANAKAFTNGWFRTGDQGFLDADGYLRLSGRLKEIINRGGEKVAPLEVDAVLMDHPSVAQCVTFAMPHEKLGEDVAAAVVLREGFAGDERSLRDFAGERLAAFKVPRRIVFVAEIPKGATGKLQRIGLAARLGL